MPAVARLRHALPEARIDWLVEKYAQPILANSRNVDHVIEINTLRWRRSLLSPAIWGEILQATRELRKSRYDFVLELQGLWKSALIASLSNAREILGWNRQFVRESHSSIFYSRWFNRQDHRENVIFEHLRFVDAFLGTVTEEQAASQSELLPESIEFDLLTSEADRRWVDEQLLRHPIGMFVILNPGANWKSKLWPLEKYAELAKRMWKELNCAIVVAVGPGEKKLGEAILARSPDPHCVMMAPSLTQFAALAERARLFVGPDTGPLHIAAACRTPIVGIFAPTDPIRNGPFNPLDVVVHQNRCGRYCHRRDCGTSQCIADITVDAVFNAVLERLRRSEFA